MIKKLKSINHITLLDDYYLLEPKIEWDIYGISGNQSKQFDLQLGNRYKIKPYIEGTNFEKYIKEFNLFRTRLMWLGPKACYSVHSDLNKRIHIPLITNPQCFLIFKDGPFEHISVGFSYLIDSTLEHTAINGSNDWRLHLVGDIKD